jgi:hypothetical protein
MKRFREQIDNPPVGKTPDDMRFERYKYEKGVSNLSAADEAALRARWDKLTTQLRLNAARGGEEEAAALAAAGIKNNNLTAEGGGPLAFDAKGDPVELGTPGSVRPDGIGETHVVDVKAISKGEDTVDFTKQLVAEKEAAQKLLTATGEPRKLGVVISSESRVGVGPSRPLANNATVFHRNSVTGQWSRWDTKLNNGAGGWFSTTKAEAAAVLGGTIP